MHADATDEAANLKNFQSSADRSSKSFTPRRDTADVRRLFPTRILCESSDLTCEFRFSPPTK